MLKAEQVFPLQYLEKYMERIRLMLGYYGTPPASYCFLDNYVYVSTTPVILYYGAHSVGY